MNQNRRLQLQLLENRTLMAADLSVDLDAAKPIDISASIAIEQAPIAKQISVSELAAKSEAKGRESEMGSKLAVSGKETLEAPFERLNGDFSSQGKGDLYVSSEQGIVKFVTIEHEEAASLDTTIVVRDGMSFVQEGDWYGLFDKNGDLVLQVVDGYVRDANSGTDFEQLQEGEVVQVGDVDSPMRDINVAVSDDDSPGADKLFVGDQPDDYGVDPNDNIVFGSEGDEGEDNEDANDSLSWWSPSAEDTEESNSEQMETGFDNGNDDEEGQENAGGSTSGDQPEGNVDDGSNGDQTSDDQEDDEEESEEDEGEQSDSAPVGDGSKGLTEDPDASGSEDEGGPVIEPGVDPTDTGDRDPKEKDSGPALTPPSNLGVGSTNGRSGGVTNPGEWGDAEDAPKERLDPRIVDILISGGLTDPKPF